MQDPVTLQSSTLQSSTLQSVVPQTLTLHTPLDMHVHLRQGDMLHQVTWATADVFSGAIVMPNVLPPITTVEALEQYKSEIETLVQGKKFVPYMTLFFQPYPKEVLEAAKPHIAGIKLYPAGITTNSAAGIQDLQDAAATLALMEALNIPLLVHGETHGFVMDREEEFSHIYADLATRYPKLTIIMEHITTCACANLLDMYPNLHATITLHHLLLTLDDVAGDMLAPHLFCKPIAKRPEDRKALRTLALSAHPKVMFGSDSAPHPRHAKEAVGCAAGVFSAPVALPMLAELFAKNDALDKLQAFVSDNARAIYGLTPPTKTVTLSRTPFSIPRYLHQLPTYPHAISEKHAIQEKHIGSEKNKNTDVDNVNNADTNSADDAVTLFGHGQVCEWSVDKVA